MKNESNDANIKYVQPKPSPFRMKKVEKSSVDLQINHTLVLKE
jgi:hypothetical protein